MSQGYLTLPRSTGSRTDAIFAVAAEARTYRNLAYLLLAFPLGLAYFVLFAAGFALGTALFLTIVGLPVLLLVAAASWRLAAFERRLAHTLLDEGILPAFAGAGSGWPGWQPLLTDSAARVRVWHLLQERLTNPVTIRGLAYLVAKLPLGVASLAAVGATYGLALALFLAPITYGLDGLSLRVGSLRINSLEEAFVSFLVAPVALLVSMHVSNAVAWASGRFAAFMLTPEAQP